MPCRPSSEVPVAATSVLELLVRGLLAGVDPLEVGHQLGRDPLAGLADRVARADPGQQGPGLGGGEVLLRATGQHFQQDPVQLADLAGVLLADRAAPVDQQLQHLELLVGDDRAQPGHPGADQRDRVRVGGVGLAALPGREHPRPRGQLRRHVHDVLAVGEQPVGDVPADALAALDRPDPLRPRRDECQHRLVALDGGVEPATTDDGLVGDHHLDRDAAFVRVHPDHDPRNLLFHDVLRCLEPLLVGRGGHRYLEQSNPFLSLSCPAVPGRRSPCESHTTKRGQPRVRATNPGTWTEPAQAPVLTSMKQVPN